MKTDEHRAVASTSMVRRALERAWKVAKRHREAEAALAKMVKNRYGIAPNDVDCDPFIDSVDYGHGPISLEELDGYMTDAGYPPNVSDQ